MGACQRHQTLLPTTGLIQTSTQKHQKKARHLRETVRPVLQARHLREAVRQNQLLVVMAAAGVTIQVLVSVLPRESLVNRLQWTQEDQTGLDGTWGERWLC